MTYQQTMPISEATRLCDQMRAAGYAVVIFSPNEVADENVKALQDSLIEHGNAVLADLQPE